MSKRLRKLLSFLLAFLLTGILQIGVALAVEVDATEIVAGASNGEIVVKQGESTNFQIKLNTESGSLAGSTSSDPGYVIVDTNYNVVDENILSGNRVSLDNTGNLLKFTEGGYNLHYVNATVIADRNAVIGTYTTKINIFIHNPFGKPGLLTNSAVDTITIKVVSGDNKAPELKVNKPVNGGCYTSSSLPDIDYTVSDDRDSNPVVIIPDFPRNEGTHTVELKTIDASGNVGTASVIYTIDNTAPCVCITSPVDGGYYKTMPDISYNKSDNDSVLKVVQSDIQSGDGTRILTVTATDRAGNEGKDSVTFTIDSTNPVISISKPVNGSLYNTNDLPESLEYGVKDENRDIDKENITGYDRITEGIHTAKVTATDKAGNSGYAETNYTVDNTAPSLAIDFPQNQYFSSEGLPDLVVNAKDNYDEDPNITIPMELSKEEGTHTYTVTALDKAGNSVSQDISYTIDNIKPDLNITNLTNGKIYALSELPEEIKYRAYDNYDSNPAVSISGFEKSEGEHTATITATDAAGNLETKTITYMVDSCPPQITLSQRLEQGKWTNEDVTIEAYIAEAGSGLKERKWARGEQSIGYFAANGTILEDSFTASSNGIYTVYAKDVVGNECIKTIEIKNVDKTSPVITVNGIAEGDILKFNQKTTINWSADDDLSGIAEASGNIANGSELDTKAAGEHTLAFTAIDNAGNIKTLIITYYVEYVFGGTLQPVINNKSTFKLGSTIPVKFQLKDYHGSVLNTEVGKLPVIRLEKITDTVLGTVMEPIYFNTATLGNEFRFDPANYQYVFNLSTKGWAIGTYDIIIDLKDGSTPQRVRISSK